ncbi:DNA repair protein REV1 isoform X1 [Drosophila pseudoobscura]|uniref:DNA repair protein REV1 n=2 Tax=Drosophila pseudoobscura pseudoobscura TaxID=46245 RepID=A0A6I8UBC5_DROPS|nr:DNA repair protein REV1 isoform X1 [Drosophila pseudoobscura]
MADEDDNGFGEWGGYFEAKKSKLEEQFAAASDPFRKSNLFQGISIFVNGLTNPSANELKQIMMVHGGIYHHYERPHTKFIIASNLPDVKVRNMNTSKIISAQYIVDCLENKRVLDYKPYLLYTNQKTTQPRLHFGKGKNTSRTNESMAVPKSETAAEPPLVEPVEADLSNILNNLQQVVATSPKNETAAKAAVEVSVISNNSARTAVDPAFLSEFYKNSRLHHIATLGAGFKQYVCELRQANGGKPFPKRDELRSVLSCDQVMNMSAASVLYIMHIDMDCFFVSVGLRSHPEWRGLPIAVTHSKGGNAATDVPVHPQADRQAELKLFAERFEHQLHDNIRADKVRSGFDKKMSLSEIASCSYEARAKGIRNGMFVGQALKLCPELKTIPYDFEGYKEVAFALYDTVAQYTLNIEAVSCDEMFVDLTDLVEDLQVDVMSFVAHLREEVRNKTGCPCSAGVGTNKLLARMATKRAKPDGQYLLGPGTDVLGYMAPTALETLPGVGSSLRHKLEQAGLRNCADVQRTSLQTLESVVGKKLALTLYENCRGIDTRPLVYEQKRKTVSAEVNYGIRFTNNSECETFLRQLSAEVTTRLTDIKRKAKSIGLKVMVRAAEAPIEASKFMGHGVCDTINKSFILAHATDDVNVITSHVLRLMKESGLPPHELRGIGIHLSKLSEATEVKKDNVLLQMFEKMSEKRKGEPTVEVHEEPEPTVFKEKENDLEFKKPQDLPSVWDTVGWKNSANKSLDKSPVNVSDRLGNTTIDMEVFAQLPEYIRREVLENMDEHLIARSSGHSDRTRKNPIGGRRSSMPCPPSSLPRMENNCSTFPVPKDADGPLELLRAVKPTTAALMLNGLQNHLLGSNYKSMLADWVSNEQYPNPTDILMINSKLSELAQSKQMGRIYDIMKHLCRLIKKKRDNVCEWHMAYKVIEESVQHQLMAIESYMLKLPDTISCVICHKM